MQRPKGIIAIAVLFGLAAAYLCTIAAVLLVSPGAISLMAANIHVRTGIGRTLHDPAWKQRYAVLAFGLFRLWNRVRWIAILVVAFSIAPLVQKISTAELGVIVLWYGLQIALHVAVGWYLAQAPAVLDAFTKQRHGSTRILTDKSESN